MRKTVLLLLTLCLSVAAHADFVTVDQAKAKAAAFLTEHSKSKKHIQASQLKLSNPSARKSPALTTSSKPCYYIFNSPDSTGFVIVSAESSTVEILAYSNEGYFHTEDIDKGAEVFLNQYTKDIKQVRSEGLTAEQQAYVSKTNKALSFGEVLLKTANLNQYDGDWDTKYCPLTNGTSYVPAGCVATAAAIIMHYHKWPATGKGSNSYVSATHQLSLSRDFSQDTYDWDCIPYTQYYEGSQAWTNKAKDEIGKIELACGIASNMDYDYDGSSASEYNMLYAMFRNFSYACDYTTYSKTRGAMPAESWEAACSSIDSNMPVMVTGGSSRGGHCFVLDGYNSSYYHYNMGWGGYNNGWYVNGSISSDNFSIGSIHTNIQPQTGRTVTSGATSNGINYSIDDAGVLNISGSGSIPEMSPYVSGDAVTECKIEEGITGIDDYGFNNFQFTNIILPSTLTTLGNAPFLFCSNLATIKVSDKNSVLKSYSNTCLYDMSTCTILINCPNASIYFPEGVKNIGNWAFSETTAESVDIPEGVEKIGQNAFRSALNLKEIHLPSTMSQIDFWAFGYCPITKLICDAMYSPTLDDCAFIGSTENATLYVPYEAVDRYKENSGWSEFSTINAIPGSENWENTHKLAVTLSSAGTLSTVIPTDYSNVRELIICGDINGDDISLIRDITEKSVSKITILDMKDARIVQGGSYLYKNQFTIEVTENDAIPEDMLRGCKVSKWIMPSSIKSIHAFCLPSGLKTIELPDGLKTIYTYAFFSSSLQSLTIPASVEEIGNDIVSASWYLTQLEVDPANPHYKSVDNTIYSIDGKIAVASVKQSGDEVVVPEGVEQIYSGTYAYGYYKSITLPSTVTSIGYYAMASNNLETINCLTTTPPEIDESPVYPDRVQFITVYVPEASVSAYKSAPVWSKFNIVGTDFTGIDTITSDTESNVNQRIYTITGMSVPSGKALRPGIYIINGKKTVIK